MRIRVLDAAGKEVASTEADLAEHLTTFGEALDGLPPGDYTVEVAACFGDN